MPLSSSKKSESTDPNITRLPHFLFTCMAIFGGGGGGGGGGTPIGAVSRATTGVKIQPTGQEPRRGCGQQSRSNLPRQSKELLVATSTPLHMRALCTFSLHNILNFFLHILLLLII